MIVTEPLANPTATCDRSSRTAKAEICIPGQNPILFPSRDGELEPEIVAWHSALTLLIDSEEIHLLALYPMPRLSKQAHSKGPPQL